MHLLNFFSCATCSSACRSIKLRLHDGELRVRPLQFLLLALQVCAQAPHLCVDNSDVDANGAGDRMIRISQARETCCGQIARRLWCHMGRPQAK